MSRWGRPGRWRRRVAARSPGGRASRRERGEALLLAVFVVLLLGISLALLALGLRIRIEESQREIRRARLDQLLDGVVAETLARLATDPGFAGVALRREGAGEGWSEVARLGSATARIEAGARLGPRSAGARAWVELGPGAPRLVRWQRGDGSGPSP